MHINICSIINKIDLVRYFITTIDIDCLSISETWLRDPIPNELLHIKGYNLTRLDRPNTNKYNRGGGICVYTKSKYDVELLEGMPEPNLDLECIGLKLSCNNVNVINCITVYRPPRGDVNNCLSKLHDVIFEIKKRKKHNTIVHGDFNINYGNKTCRWAKELKNWETSLLVNQLVKVPTRITDKTSSMIDLCFTDLNHVSLAGVLDMNMSDHFPTVVLIKKMREIHKRKSFIGRSYANFSAESIEEAVENHLPPLVNADPNLEWEQMEETYMKVADDVCPLTNFQIKNDRPGYFSDELSTAIRKRDLLFRRARVSKNKITWNKAKKKKREVRLMLRRDKRNYVTRDIGHCKNNVNKFWRGVSSLLHRKKSSTITEILDSHGKIVKGREAASEINHYFCNIGPNLASKVPLPTVDFATSKAPCAFVWGGTIRTEDVLREIDKLDIKKSSGIPQISCRILKSCLLSTAKRFTDLLNSCVRKGIFPRKWKQALVVPIPKGRGSKLVSNIRPISLLPVTGKILEKIMLARMQPYLLSNGLICTEQSGFRKNFGTFDPITELFSFVNRSFNERKMTLCIYIDMAKAFNCLDCNILAQKLYDLGFEGTFYNLLKSYLTEREQAVNFNGELSEMNSLSFGVAQGSILGPQMFSLYMNDLPKFFKHMTVRMYADDTIFFCDIDDTKNLANQIDLINGELEVLMDWCKYNRVTINVDKTKCMLFASTARKISSAFPNGLPPLYLAQTQLNYVTSYRYLGIDLDSQLTMGLHVQNVINRVKPLLYQLGKLRYFINESTALCIYKSFILPNLEIGNYLLDGVVSNQTKKLQKVQNQALRTIYRTTPLHPSYSLHLLANLLSLDFRKVACLLRIINIKLLKGDGVFKVANRDTRTRDGVRVGVKLATDFPRLERFKRSINYNGPAIWNSLPANCLENQWPPAFKSKVKNHLWIKFKERGSTSE